MRRRMSRQPSLFATGGHTAILPSHILTFVVGFVIAISAIGCVSSPSGATAGADEPASSSSPSGDAVTNPFTIVGRWNASKLGLHDPADLAIGPSGDVYVTDRTQRVTEISPAGSVVRQWGRRGSRRGQFEFISPDRSAGWNVAASIAVGSDGRVYVSDSGNGRVEIFSPSGKFLSQLGSEGSGDTQFIQPDSLLVDPGGDLYVSDGGARTLSKFSSTGRVEWRIGGATGDADLNGHFHFANTDPHGVLIVANDDQGRILYIDSHSHKLDTFGRGSGLGASGTFRDGICDVSVDASGDMFVNSCEEPLLPKHYTEVFDPHRALVGAWNGSPFSESPRFGPNGVIYALGFDGSILRLKVALPGA